MFAKAIAQIYLLCFLDIVTNDNKTTEGIDNKGFNNGEIVINNIPEKVAVIEKGKIDVSPVSESKKLS